MSKPKRGLGRGLNALIRTPPPGGAADVETAVPAVLPRGIVQVPVTRLAPSPWQPRRTFAPEALEELAASVKERGVLQPLLVRRVGEGYELIAGERRWRAATQAGLTDVPAIVMNAADKDALELAVIENVQREDLNVIEEAEAYRALAERFSLTQEEIAARTGKARASVANTLRLLGLAPPVRQLLAEGRLSAGHAKVLLGVADEEAQRMLALRVIRDGLSVRDLERVIARPSKTRPIAGRASAGAAGLPETHVETLTDRLQRRFGTRVRIVSAPASSGSPGKGRIEVEFFSHEDLDRILGLMGLDAQDDPG